MTWWRSEPNLQQPQYDANGDVTPHDHNEILNEDVLIRRIDPVQHVVPDENRGGKRISSKAFQPSSSPTGGMSVDIERLIVESGQDSKQFVTTPKFTGSVAFAVGVARSASLLVGFDPLEDNPFHGEVWGKARPNRFTGSQTTTLRNAASWYVAIDGVDII
jgi:hypothetical protein